MFIGNIHSDMPCHAGEESRICSVLFVCMHVLCGKMWYRSQKVSVSNLRTQRRNSISVIDHKRFCTYAFSLSPLNLSPDTHLSFLLHFCFQFSFVLFHTFRSFAMALSFLVQILFSSSRLVTIVSQQICMIYIVSTEANWAPLITELTKSRVSQNSLAGEIWSSISTSY